MDWDFGCRRFAIRRAGMTYCLPALLLLAAPATANVWVQGNWQGGAVSGSTTSVVSGWSLYDSQDGNAVALSTGLQTRQGIPGAWTQTDDGAGLSGFNLAGSSFNVSKISGTGAAATLQMVNVETVTAQTATMPGAQFENMGIAAFPATGKIYLFGSATPTGSTNQILQYDPASDNLSVAPTTLRDAIQGPAAAYHPGKNKIYVFGGIYGGCGLPCSPGLIQEYDPSSATISTKSATFPTVPTSMSAVYFPPTNKIYIFGGDNGVSVSSAIWVYDPTADTLATMSAVLPSSPSWTSAAYDPGTNKIYVFGGMHAITRVVYSDVIRYDPIADTATVVAALPNPEWRTAAVYQPATGKIEVFGGTKDSGLVNNTIAEFDPATNAVDVRPTVLPSVAVASGGVAGAYFSGTGDTYLFTNTDSNILKYHFNARGAYTSGVFDAGSASNFSAASWNPVAQATSSVTLAIGVRAGSTPVPDATWSNSGAFAAAANGGSLASLGPNRYAQYIATFTTTDASTSPVLNDITIGYTQTAASATLVSSAYNSGGPLNIVQKISWQGTFPSGTTVQFQIRTASDNGGGFPATWSPWLGPTAATDYYTDPAGGQAINPAHSDGINDQWVQYKVQMISSNTLAAATLSTVTVTYGLLPAAPFLNSLTANTSTQLSASWTDNSTNEDEFVVSSGTVSGPTNLGATVATLNKAGTGGAQSISVVGLSPNTTYFVRVRAHVLPAVDLYSFYSNELSLATLASPPTNMSVTAVYGSSAAVSWNAGGNPAGTPFEVSVSTDNFALNISTPVAFSSNLTAAATTLYNLSSGTTYYFRVRARNLAGVATAFAATASTPTLPGALGPPSGAALGVSSITWSWTNTVGPVVQGYNVYSAATGLLLAAATSTAYVQTGLAANTPYGIAVVALDASGAGPPSAAATTYALAAPPSATAFSAIYVSSLTVAWNNGGNPAATVFEVRRATDGVSFALVSSQTAVAFTDTQLGNATYYYKIRALNGNGIASVYDATISTFMAGQPPAPPSGLTLANSSGTAVTLTWNASPGPGLIQYDIYWDSGTGAVNYAAAYSTVAASTTSFTTGLLAPGTYYFAVRAKNSIFLEEQNTNVRASIAVVSAAPIANWMQTRLQFPASGKTVWGNRVTLDAGLLRGSLAGISQVRFDYRSAASTTAPWIAVPATESNNPVLKPPFYIHWDVTGLAPGAYEVRAVASNGAGQDDPDPPTSVVTVGPVNPDITETLVGGSIQHLETVSNAVDNVAFVGGPAGGQTLEVQLPAGALGASTVLQIVDPVAAPPSVPTTLSASGISAQITLQSGQTSLVVPALLTATYQNANGDGIVDGTSARADRLVFMVYQTASATWKSENPTTLDLAGKTVSVQTPHFSVFGVFAAAASALDSVRVYPNPYRPNGGNPDQGKPYSSGDSSSGVIFDNLTQGARIQIYDVSGELVWQTASDLTDGKIQWDSRNSQGRDVATGGYIAVIRDLATGRSVVKKIAIIRH
ncbi:MAG: fibronectin type III domain-containing protein [Elusimicrobia bacterium]|nr:fibronectin type III domain-containing protein [Elusimicrobiota bacterium]